MKNKIIVLIKFLGRLLWRVIRAIVPPLSRIALWTTALALVVTFIWAGWSKIIEVNSDYLMSFF